ncbi:MAG TPA: serine/threonine-protein kinase, partial [Cyanophyceae cyanobacterium]
MSSSHLVPISKRQLMILHPGMLLQNRYRILKRLGKGGFGQALEVDDRGTLKVLKVLNLERFQSPESKQKAISLFQREATVLSRLKHPGIPRVEPDGYFMQVSNTGEELHGLIMEKIEGQTLKQWMESHDSQPVTQAQALVWLKELAEILTQVHHQDLVHRDLKPSNIMLRPNGQLVLIDFGAVREVTETYLQRQKENVTGTVIISAGYTPPEQAEGKAVPQSDFFALGRTFVYLLTGKSPTDFDRDPRTGRLLWRDSAPQASKELADLIDYLMAIFPGRRPQTPEVILRCLEEIDSCDLPPVLMPTREIQPKAKSDRESPPQMTQPSHPSLTGKKKPFLAFISNFLPSSAPPSPWQRVEVRRTLSKHTDVIKSIAISPDGQILASGSYDRTIKLWSLRTGELLHTLTGHGNRVSCIAISPDSQLLASGSYDRTVRIWSLGTGELLETLVGHTDRVRSVSFSPNGQMLISSAIQVRLWAARTGKLLRTFAEQSNSAQLVAFSPDGQTCVVGSLDGTIELWNPHNGKRLHAFASYSGGVTSGGITSLGFSRSSETLITACGTSLQIWDLNTNKQLRALSSSSGGFSSMAFSPDNRTLACGAGKSIELWDLPSGKRLCTLSGHSKPVESVAF